MDNPFQQLAPALQARRQQSLYRTRPTLESAQGSVVQLEGKRYLGFCSNDYLGHASHPAVIKAFQVHCASSGLSGH